jgi:hypothetical protein
VAAAARSPASQRYQRRRSWRWPAATVTVRVHRTDGRLPRATAARYGGDRCVRGASEQHVCGTRQVLAAPGGGRGVRAPRGGGRPRRHRPARQPLPPGPWARGPDPAGGRRPSAARSRTGRWGRRRPLRPSAAPDRGVQCDALFEQPVAHDFWRSVAELDRDLCSRDGRMPASTARAAQLQAADGIRAQQTALSSSSGSLSPQPEGPRRSDSAAIVRPGRRGRTGAAARRAPRRRTGCRPTARAAGPRSGVGGALGASGAPRPARLIAAERGKVRRSTCLALQFECQA